MTKRAARHFAKAIIHLGLAEFNSSSVRDIRNLRNLAFKCNKRFHKSGYEFGAGDGSRIRLRRA